MVKETGVIVALQPDEQCHLNQRSLLETASVLGCAKRQANERLGWLLLLLLPLVPVKAGKQE